MCYCFHEDKRLQEILGMLLFNTYFHAWPTSKLFSLKLMEQILLPFADHSYGSFEIKIQVTSSQKQGKFSWACREYYQEDNSGV